MSELARPDPTWPESKSTPVDADRGEVKLLRTGTEINADVASRLQSLCHGNVLDNADLLVYYHSDTMSFRYGRIRLSGPAAISFGASMTSIPTETRDQEPIQSLDPIDILLFRSEHVPDDWIQGRVLGQGAFGCVFEAIDIQSGTRLAVKQVPIAILEQPAGEIDDKVVKLCAEVDMLKRVSHDNIIRYMGARLHWQHQCLYIFMELVPSGSLFQLIRQYGPLPEPLICNYTRQIVRGLRHLHACEIVHRDIKGSNILITTDGVIKLADFGAARHLQDSCWAPTAARSVCGTPGWMAPEVVRRGAWSPSSDIWSLACVVIEMGTGSRPWPGLNQYEILYALAHTDRTPDIPASLSDLGRDLVRQCLQVEPDRRPTAAELLEHPLLNL